MECIVKKNRQKIISSKTWREPKTVIFTQLKEMHKLLTDYSSLWISPVDSVGDRNQQETDNVNDGKHVRLLTRHLSGS